MQKESEPIEYVRGFTDFLECRIDLSKKPLIPRLETEFWVGKALKEVRGGRALDIFAGSGCIGIAALKHVQDLLCDFGDIDEKNLDQIKINLRLNKINPKRYQVIKSDVFKNIKGKYDYIFANPPYVAISKINQVQKSVLEYEPKIALMAGEDGLLYIAKFLEDAKSHLNPEGIIFMEFSPEQKNKIKELAQRIGYQKCSFIKDQFKRYRCCILK